MSKMWRAALVCVVAGQSAAWAGVTVYTDRSAWEAAVGRVVGSENFNSGAVLSAYTPNLAGPGITSYFGNVDDFRLVGADMSFRSAITNDRQNWSWNSTSPRLTAGGSLFGIDVGGTLSVEPSSSVGAVGGFGFDWQSTGARALVSVNFLGGDVSEAFELAASQGQANRFFGIVSDGGANIASLNLNTFSGDVNQIHFDDFALGATPAPGALALLGMGGLVASRRRR
ncbi:MAG: hypothetical protein ACOYN0_08095 [Phycisphaerales bacterium]